jgi:hypothetical protein
MKRVTKVISAALVAVLTAGLLLPTAGASAKAPRRFAGVHYPFTTAVTPGTAQHMKRAGVSSVVLNIYWPVVEPAPGMFDVAALDQSIGDLAAAGIESTPIVAGTPRWALDQPLASDPNANHVPPTSSKNGPGYWAQFVQTLARRYGPAGTYWQGTFQAQHPGAKPRPIRVWQVWNEPNLFTYNWPKPDPKAYARLLKISHDAITAVDPKAKIAIGGLVCVAKYPCQRYLRNLYKQHGVTRYFNLVGLHPYGSTVKVVINGVRRARREMKRAHDGRTKVWVSEIGWGSAHPDHHLNKGRKGQARLLKKAYRRLERSRRKLRIWGVAWFDWNDGAVGTGNCSWCGSAGLLDTHNHPKPSYKAFKRVT